jgi:hypothetical protein
MGKGSTRRPSFVSTEEYSLRHDLAFGFIDRQEFDREMQRLRREAKKGKNQHVRFNLSFTEPVE